MANRVTSYNANEQTLIFCNYQIDSGFAEGEFVNVEMNGNDWEDKSGSDGEVARARTNDKRATIKIKLMQGSLGNNILQQIRAKDLASPNGAGVGVFELVNRASGVVTVHADKCWIQKPPAISRSNEITENEWTLRSAHLELDLSGDPSI